jgi:hypothetical protein
MEEDNKVQRFVKGGMGGPGRPKNTINKNRMVGEVLNKLNFEPLKEAIAIFRDIDTPVKVKTDIVLKVMRLVYPEVKQIQVESHSIENSMNPIAEAMLQIQDKKSGFDYNARIPSDKKDGHSTNEPSTTN